MKPLNIKQIRSIYYYVLKDKYKIKVEDDTIFFFKQLSRIKWKLLDKYDDNLAYIMAVIK